MAEGSGDLNALPTPSLKLGADENVLRVDLDELLQVSGILLPHLTELRPELADSVITPIADRNVHPYSEQAHLDLRMASSSNAPRSPAFHQQMTRRTISTFSCHTARPVCRAHDGAEGLSAGTPPAKTTRGESFV
jgi:hypothetical protein